MKTVVCTLLLLAIVNHSEAHYPISPQPLRKLIIESDNIIIGYVDDIKIVKEKSKHSTYQYSVAVVKVRELLKGTMEEKVIEISFNPNMICPAPPFFVKATDVVLFLDNGKYGGYRTTALSYSLKTLDSAGISAYRNRIVEMINILKIKDDDFQIPETVEWLVKCAENPTTRWEGTYELSPESDFMSYYDRNPVASYRYMISPEQKSRLKNALLSGSKTDYNNFGIVDLLYTENKDEIFKFLCEGLRELDERNLYTAEEFMKRICLVNTSTDLRALLTRFNETVFDFKHDRDQKEIDAIVTSFKDKMETH